MLTRLRKLGPAGYMAAGFVGAALLLGGTGAAYAANGGSFILGANNAETKGAGLSNTAGTPLYLASKAGTPPLVVYSTTKVPRLNADALDGKDSTAFALTAGKTGIIMGSSSDADNDASTVACPAGTIATGGGGFAPQGADYLWYSGPDYDVTATTPYKIKPNTWAAFDDNGDATAYVTCYNPLGAVPGAATTMPSYPSTPVPYGVTPNTAGKIAHTHK